MTKRRMLSGDALNVVRDCIQWYNTHLSTIRKKMGVPEGEPLLRMETSVEDNHALESIEHLIANVSSLAITIENPDMQGHSASLNFVTGEIDFGDLVLTTVTSDESETYTIN